MRKIFAVAIVTVFVAVACGGTDSLAVTDVWGRTSPAAVENAAFYMDISGGGDADRLVSVSTDACGMVELHETVMADGVMAMQHLPAGIDIPAGETVKLEPGGYHVMCMMKQAEFTAGDTYELTLDFETADDMTVDVEIREE